jgi:superfamily II DNA or RNA helicase
MPAYSYDPYMYRFHKQKGGAFKDYKDKTYLELNDFELAKHLSGQSTIGVYPLLKDNTSWFIVADFDKGDWKEQSKKAIAVLEKSGIVSYLERSRSGNGGHVWVFFEQPYPAFKSRKLILSIFEEQGVFSVFDKNNSFDRLFPNQDYLSGKGFGNLIALPLQGTNLLNGNSCFVDPNTFTSYSNQWKFLSEIKRVSISLLDKIYDQATPESYSEIATDTKITISNKLEITLTNCISLNRSGVKPIIARFLKEQLNFYNSEFVVKKKMGKSTWKTERYFNLIEEKENTIVIPSGFIGNLIRFCKQNSIAYSFSDLRRKLPEVDFSSSIRLLNHQKEPLLKASKKDFGIIVAPPGAGKTIMGLKLIEQKKQPALIITHRKQIAEQWIARIETFFDISKREIGRIGQGKIKIGKQITVALIQSLSKKLDESSKELKTSFGTILIDECHHIPATSFRKVIHQLTPYYQYGLTATPFRKNNDEKMLFYYLGDIIAEIKPQQIETFKKARLIVRDTNLDVPFNTKTDHFETLSKILIHDSERNKLILTDLKTELAIGRKVVVITERTEHIETLFQCLKRDYECITISGKDSATSRDQKWQLINQGNYQAILTTGQYFGEGIDIKDVSCLFLVYPFAFKGKLIQYIGRVQRTQLKPIIYDYRDRRIPYLEKLFLKRNTYYKNLDRQATLFDDFKDEIPKEVKANFLSKKIRIPINDLEFHYGLVSFSYEHKPLKNIIYFNIENEEIQPEFDVLKPYFAKVLKSKYISVIIQAEFDNKELISQLATSVDIDQINKEIISSVKFQFLERNFFKNTKVSKDNLAEKEIEGIFNSETNLIDAILQSDKYLHSRHLNYLSKNHNHKQMKIRYVLHPFAFVFLLVGEHKNHIVLETLDSKEATYIWHLPKDFKTFQQELRRVNNELNFIKNNGRQFFLEKYSRDFSRIIHNYATSDKGFYNWKNALEEKLM